MGLINKQDKYLVEVIAVKEVSPITVSQVHTLFPAVSKHWLSAFNKDNRKHTVLYVADSEILFIN